MSDLARRAVWTFDDLCNLDPAEIAEGYRDAREGLPCGDNRSRAYWHGWTCAKVDRQEIAKPISLAYLAREVFERFNGDLVALDVAHTRIFAARHKMGLV